MNLTKGLDPLPGPPQEDYTIQPISRALALAVVHASVLNSSRVKIASGSSALNSVQVSPQGCLAFPTRHLEASSADGNRNLISMYVDY
jgi:hypothetical protein